MVISLKIIFLVVFASFGFRGSSSFSPEGNSCSLYPGSLRWDKPLRLKAHVPISSTDDDDREGAEFFDAGRRKFVPTVSSAPFALLFLSRSASAERTLGTVTESYRRYVPRMEEGFAYLSSDLPDALRRGAFDEATHELTAERGTRISAMKGTMKIFATAFSDQVVSIKTREMQLALYKTNGALEEAAAAARGGDGDGAVRACGEAAGYAQIYSEVANSLLPRSLDPIRGPGGVGRRPNEKDPTDISGAF